MKIVGKQHTFQTSDGTEIAYLKLGNSKQSTSSPVVLLHGMGGSASSLELLAEELGQKGYYVLIPDLRGHGFSERTEQADAYSFARLAQDVVELCQHEQVSSCIVVGHCFGGMIAQELIFEEELTLEKLILISTARELFLSAKIITKLHLQKLLIYIPAILPVVHKVGRVDYKQYIGTGEYYWPRIFKDLAHTSLKSYGYSMYTALFELRRKVQNIVTPTLIIAGGQDRLFPKAITKKLTAVFHNHQYVEIPDANHIIPLSHWQQLGEAIDTFIKKTPLKV